MAKDDHPSLKRFNMASFLFPFFWSVQNALFTEWLSWSIECALSAYGLLLAMTLLCRPMPEEHRSLVRLGVIGTVFLIHRVYWSMRANQRAWDKLPRSYDDFVKKQLHFSQHITYFVIVFKSSLLGAVLRLMLWLWEEVNLPERQPRR